MSLVGLGRAFNLRYRPSTKFVGFGRPAPRMPIPMGGNYSYTENVNIQNGPSGFWGFMSGLFGGLFGGGMMSSGLFGGGMMGGGSNIFSVLNQIGSGKTQQTTSQGTQATDQNDPDHQKDLANFKTLYGDKYNIVYQDGKFIATTNDKDNKWVGEGKTFEDMNNILKDYNKGNTQEADGKPTDPKPTDEPVGNGNGDDPSAINANGNGNHSSGKVGNGTRRSSANGAKKALHHVPSGWYRSDTKTGNENVGLKLSQCKTAEQVTNKVLSSKMDYLSADAKKAITKEIIANNPSIFDNKGNVISNKWDKLDLPSVDYIKSKYMSGNATKHTNKQSGVTYVSYKDKAGKTHNQNSGINTNMDEHVLVSPNNNYKVKYTTKGAIYFDANNHRIEGAVFAKTNPVLYKNVQDYIKSHKA